MQVKHPRRAMLDYVRVTEILSIFQSFDHVNPVTLKKAIERGQIIHNAIHGYFEGRFMPVPHQFIPYFNSFNKWIEETVPNEVESETRYFSQDWELPVTGQLDLLAHIGDKLTLIDFKTSSFPKPEIWELQLTFYYMLLESNNVLELPCNGMVVNLKQDGSYPDIYLLECFEPLKSMCTIAMDCYRHFQGTRKLSLVSN